VGRHLPLPLLLGRLSDRVGRQPLLIACYLVGASSLAILALSTSLWQFYVSAGLLSVLGSSHAVALALTADLVPRPSISRAIARIDGIRWTGESWAAPARAGQRRVSHRDTFLAAAVLPLLAVLLLSLLRRERHAVTTAVPAPSHHD